MPRSVLPALSLSLILAACGGGTEPDVVTLLVALQAGDGQTAAAGTAVAADPSVRLTNSNGMVVAGTAVTFAVTAGGGSVTGATQTTDASGVATVGSWILGTAAGANALRATVSGSGISGNPINFTATGTAGPHTAVTEQAGGGGTGVAGGAVATLPAVLVQDQFANPVGGVAVTFAVTGGGGSVTGGQQNTGADGVATVGGWTLGNVVGENTLTATVQDAALQVSAASANSVAVLATGSTFTVVFTVTGIAGAPGIVEKTAGDGQSATIGTMVDVSPSVRVTDLLGNPIAGATVSFAVASGGGQISGETATTDADGMAALGGWTLGSTPGENTVTATVGEVSATFTATGTPLTIEKTAGDDQTASVNTAVGVQLKVLVTNADGEPVEGVDVTFAVESGGGLATGTSKTTAADGTAMLDSWTLGSTPGENTLIATAVGADAPVTFTATATPLTLEIAAGDGQTALVSTAVPVALQVRVKTAAGDPVGGVDVAWALGIGGGALTGTTTTTAADGLATLGSWTLGPVAGANTVTATAVGEGIVGNPVTFTATGTLLLPTTVAIVQGDGQTAIAGTPVLIPPAVLVTGAGGVPVPNVLVTYGVTGGGGAVTVGGALGAAGSPNHVDVLTGLDGVAQINSWTLGNVGPNTLLATVDGTGIAGNPVTFNATGALNPEDFAGAWVGSWDDVSNMTTGSVTATVTVTPAPAVSGVVGAALAGGTATLVVDFNGGVLGIGDPAPETHNVTYTAAGIEHEIASVFWGALTASTTPDGMVTMTALNPSPGFSRVDLTGTLTVEGFSGDWVVTFTGGFQVFGTWTMTR